MNPDELENLSHRFFRNELDESETSELKALLKKGGPECDAFLDELYRSQQLVNVGQQLQNSKPQEIETSRKIIKIRLWPIAAAVLLAFGLYYSVQSYLMSRMPEVRKPVLAQWVKLSEDKTVVGQVSQYIHPGSQKLPEGNYQLVFSNGTKVNLNQKAEFELIDEENMILNYGNLLAEVSEETKSFRVQTPGADVVDLGTVFGIQVNEAKDSRIYVTDGVVAVQSLHSKDKKVLRMQDQIEVDSKGVLGQKTRYIKPLEEVIPEIQSMPNRKNLRWVHWNFEKDFVGYAPEKFQQNPREVVPTQSDMNALPKVCESPFGKGIRFDGVDDALVSSTADMPSLAQRTLSFWLRLPTLKELKSQELLSYGSIENGWGLSINQDKDQGNLEALKINLRDGHLTGTSSLSDGRWHHIAVVFTNGDQSEVSTQVLMYVDGVIEKVSSYKPQTPELKIETQAKSLFMGSATFGGDLDELWVFEQVLMPEEIVRLRDHNSPFSRE